MWNAALSDPTPPLYYTILHFIIRFLGESAAVMRIPSVLCGVLILPITYWTMHRASFDNEDGYYAMSLVAVSSVLIFYSQELRAYSLLAFMGVLSVCLLFRCLTNATMSNNLFYSISIFVLSYTHRYGFFLIIAQGICLCLYRKWKTLIPALLTFALAGILSVLQIIQGNLNYSEAPDRVASFGAVIALINMLNLGTMYLPSVTSSQPGPYVAYSNIYVNIGLSLLGVITFTTIFLIGVLKRREFSPVQKQCIIVLLICCFMPGMLGLLSGTKLVPKPQWLLRGLIYICPLYYMAAVMLCSKSRLKLCLLSLIVILNASVLYPYYTDYNRCREADALKKLGDQTTSNDLIVANPWYFYEVINYYCHGTAQKAGYDSITGRGWINLKKLQESDGPFDYRYLPLASAPAITGDVYFFFLINDEQCIRPFTNNEIFLYKSNVKKSWERYAMKEEKGN